VSGEDILSFGATANISGAYDPFSGTLTLTGSDTVAHYEAALRAVTYQDTNGDDPSTTARTVSLQTIDPSLGVSDAAFRHVSVLAVDDPPVAHNGSARGNEGHSIAGTALATDVDSTQTQLAFALVGANGGAQHGAVSLSSDGGFFYQPAIGFHGTDSFSFRANDGALDSNVGTVGVTVAAALHGFMGDFDGDGRSDLLGAGAGGQLGIWFMDGTSVLSQANVGPNPGANHHVVGAGDFNGDGRDDILFQADGGQAEIWLMNGTATLALANVGTNPGPSHHIAGVGDFNGDGRDDILWQDDGGQAEMWLMNGTTPTLQANVGVNPGPTHHIAGVGDFNGDGKADILWQDDSGQAELWLMNGTMPIAQASVGVNPGPSHHVSGLGDFNGDGKADILWQNDSGQAEIWLMNGATPIAEGIAGPNPGASHHVLGAGDFNGDHRADILWQDATGQGEIWLMDGLTPVAQSNASGNPGHGWDFT
jgi:hypothetical protein